MQGAEKRLFTEDEYIALERAAETKSELINGEIFAMAGAKPRHNALATNVAALLLVRLRAAGSSCVVLNSDQRIRSDVSTFYSYADAVVACSPRFHPKYTDTLINPTVIVEVLSGSTEAYDRGAKFAHYRTIPSFVEYVLVSQSAHRIDHFRRTESGQWLMTPLEGDEAVLELGSLGFRVPLGEIYAGTDALPGEGEAEPPLFEERRG